MHQESQLVTQPDIPPCDFCGTTEASNTRLESDWTVRYEDGPPRASVTGVVLCYDCADEVNEYLQARAGESGKDVTGLAPFGVEDARALLDRLEENEHLVVDVAGTSGYGIRAVNGEWKHAVFRAPGPHTIETLAREDVRERILDARRLTLKHLDQAAWDSFDHSR